MLKIDAIALFGTGLRPIADALGVSVARISQLPETLPQAYEDRVIGAAMRLGIPAARLRRIIRNPEVRS